MITTWSVGDADEGMPEKILVEQARLVAHNHLAEGRSLRRALCPSGTKSTGRRADTTGRLE